jgi:asparagine synthase (glutamine-hydrolysing)
MCGIFALLNGTLPQSLVAAQFQQGQGRGPEHSSLSHPYPQTTFGFHRLAINGLNAASNQPLVYNNVWLICNGEIYNYRALYQVMGQQGTTQSDCEVIIHLYLRYGIEYTLHVLDGVFAFVLLLLLLLVLVLVCEWSLD